MNTSIRSASSTTLCVRGGRAARFAAWALAISLAILAAGPVLAAGEGQEDLDKATDTKLNATTINDLTEVINLTESALKKGLEPANVEFANKLLSSTLLQRARESMKVAVTRSSSPEEFRKKRDSIVADLDRTVQLDPKQSETYFLIAQINLLPGGDEKKAREAVDKAIQLGIEEPAAHAKALMMRSGLEENVEKRLADLNAAVQLTPNDATPVRARGLLLGDMEKMDAALADLNKAIELDPEDGPTYEAKAIVLAHLKKFDEALATVDKARQLNPESVMPLVQRARIHSTQEKRDAAIEDLNQALGLAPDNVTVLLMRAGLYGEKGEKDKAMADVDQALKIKPNLPMAIRTRAMLLADSKRIDEAVEELEKLRAIQPEDSLSTLQLAVLYTAQKKTRKAIDTYTLVLRQDPKEWRALRGRGDLYLNLGRQADAVADYKAALTLQPKDQGILNNLAWTLATSTDDGLRNGKRAIELATLACEVSEYKEAYILSTLAAAYAETGDFANAVKWSTKAVEIAGKEHLEALKKELETYKAGKPMRESLSETPAADGNKKSKSAK